MACVVIFKLYLLYSVTTHFYFSIVDLKELEQQVNRVNIYIKNVPNLPITKNDMNTKLLEYVKNVSYFLHFINLTVHVTTFPFPLRIHIQGNDTSAWVC